MRLLFILQRVLVSRRGFSLAEVLIVTVIFSTILFAVSSFRSNLVVLNNFVNQRLQSRQDIEQTLQMMTTEIRSASPSSLGAFPIETAGTSTLTFFSDYDHDGIFERLRYFSTTSTILRGVIEPTGNPLVYATSSETVATVVNNYIPATSTPLFRYYDSAYTGTQSPLSSPVDLQAVRVIQVALSADVNTSSSPKAEFFTFTVGIRNLKSN